MLDEENRVTSYRSILVALRVRGFNFFFFVGRGVV